MKPHHLNQQLLQQLQTKAVTIQTPDPKISELNNKEEELAEPITVTLYETDLDRIDAAISFLRQNRRRQRINRSVIVRLALSQLTLDERLITKFDSLQF